MGELTKPTMIRELLGRKNIKLTRRLGQHFLVDGNLLSIMIKAADLRPEDMVLEVGAGIGTLTEELIRLAGKVWAVEMDDRLFSLLRDYLDEPPNLILIHGDAMKLNFSEIIPPEEPLKVISNLPYNIATPLLLKLLLELPGLTSLVVTVQKELADRYLSPPGSKSYGATTVKLNYYCEIRRIIQLPPSVFLPPPKIHSVMLKLEKRKETPVRVDDPEEFFRFIDAAFAQRRKTLSNSLSSLYPSINGKEIARIMEELGWNPSERAERLNLDDFAKLYGGIRGLL